MTRFLATLCIVAGLGASTAYADRASILLATTTSTQDSGLLDVLVPQFTRATGVDVKVIAVGSGAALKMAQRGDADVVLSHAPDAERLLVAAGDLVDGKLVMHNDFVLVGPPGDPAAVKRAADLDAAMKAIAQRGGFVSRGDDSGTHKKELELWRHAGIEVKAVPRRTETGQGMGATLHVADERGLYTLTDRGTFLAQQKTLTGLVVVAEGAPRLLNVYQVYLVSPTRHPKVKAAAGRKFVQFLLAPETQKTIGEFRKAELGQPLFVPDAGRPPASVGLK
jgi:tungstate transport system substrate-binding protein